MPTNKTATLSHVAIALIIGHATSQPGLSEVGSKYEDSPISTPKDPTLPRRLLTVLEKARDGAPINGTDRLVTLLPDNAITLRDWCNTTADKFLRAEKPDQARAKILRGAAIAIDAAS